MRILFCILFIPAYLLITGAGEKHENTLSFLKEYCRLRYPNEKLDRFVYVRIQEQKLYLVENWSLKAVFDVSTAVRGAGFEKDSEQTPWGLHRIAIMLGKNIPEGGILNGSRYSGKIATIETRPVSTGRDDITSRAIRLEGAESGLNKGGSRDSFTRNIYIHGTPEEGLIGTAASHGCVRMRNADIIQLFENCRVQMPVLLLNN